MKRSLILIILAVLLCAGCAKEVDWYPVTVSFYIVDSEGNDLLDPASESFIGDDISLSYKGNEYVYSIPTKTYLPVFYGLIIEKDNLVGKYCARFGELDGADNYDDDFIIRFPDGTSRTLHYDRRVNCLTVSARQKWFLDGVRVDYPVIITYQP
ncbi:MAG: hypothetical protein KBT00_03060 [Bacteroidales bacterium]|nr:hypothetical protein [Candidatus Cacconaster merdequi]